MMLSLEVDQRDTERTDDVLAEDSVAHGECRLTGTVTRVSAMNNFLSQLNTKLPGK